MIVGREEKNKRSRRVADREQEAIENATHTERERESEWRGERKKE